MKAKLSKVLKAAAIAVFAFLIFFNIDVLIDGNGFAVKMVNSLFAAEWWGDDPTGEAGGSSDPQLGWQLFMTTTEYCLKQTVSVNANGTVSYTWVSVPYTKEYYTCNPAGRDIPGPCTWGALKIVYESPC